MGQEQLVELADRLQITIEETSYSPHTNRKMVC